MPGEYGSRDDGVNKPTCARHRDTVTYVSCQRCGRPTCPRCQRPAAVGVHCVDCARERARTRRTPVTAAGAPLRGGGHPITQALIIACVAMHVASWIIPALRTWFMFVPALGLSEPWRFITNAFLHVGFLHLVMNMLALWMIGQALEPILGRWRYVALYLLSALGGSVALVVLAMNQMDWLTPAVGASGAIFGLFGALFVLGKKAHTDMRSISVLIGLNLIYGFVVPNIAWQAHIGGLIVGAAVMWGLITSAQRRSRIGAGVTIAVVMIVLVAATGAKYATVFG
ncbi:MAG: rhomboid family intramembrane serine protease [Bowdeniella nasicola]|nr:rhomboid family intramembrane serine protease [Bowdeniella nasicola]